MGSFSEEEGQNYLLMEKKLKKLICKSGLYQRFLFDIIRGLISKPYFWIFALKLGLLMYFKKFSRKLDGSERRVNFAGLWFPLSIKNLEKEVWKNEEVFSAVGDCGYVGFLGKCVPGGGISGSEY